MRRRRHQCKPYRPIAPAKFAETRLLARLSVQEAAELLHVTSRTVRNWEQGVVAIPYAAFKLLRVLLAVELPDPAWKGWIIRGDTLWSPEGRGYSARYLSYHWLTFAMARTWAEEASRRRAARVAALAAPLPSKPALWLVKG